MSQLLMLIHNLVDEYEMRLLWLGEEVGAKNGGTNKVERAACQHWHLNEL